MSVNRRIHLLLAALGCVGCGPTARSPSDSLEVENWLLGTFSSQEPPKFTMSDYVLRMTFEADGTVSSQAVGHTGRSVDEALRMWEARSDDEVEVFANEEESFQGFLVSRGEDCNTIEVRKVTSNGSVFSPGPWYRGEVCVREEAPDSHSAYELYWCDEPPPECDEP